MKYIYCLILIILFTSCSTNKTFTIAFGSCNNHIYENLLWKDIQTQKPNVWIWGGDNVYCDTEDMKVLQKCYEKQLNKPNYQQFLANVPIVGVWDDHDYGRNDAGKEYPMKETSQKLFLDFMQVPKDSKRRERNGTYHSLNYSIGNKKVKIILLDTRYFRSSLTKSANPTKRYKPNTDKGTILGVEQWKWLTETLQNSKANYNIIVSSIQFLSNQHGFESWSNMPNETEKMENLILASQAKGVIILSGDRHISELSLKKIGNNKSLIDFTSSGLNNAYADFPGEINPYRISKVIHENSYGLVKLNFKNKMVNFEMWGENKTLLHSYSTKIK